MNSRLFITFAVASSLVCGCKDDPPPPGAAPSATTSAAAKAAPVADGDMTINWKFANLALDKIEVASAIAYVSPSEISIELASPNVKGIDCGHSWRDAKLEAGQLGIVIRSQGVKYSVPFTKKPGKYEHVGYTIYYRPKDADKSTNSGNSARVDLPTELDITQLDDKTVKGTFKISFGSEEGASGSFTAKVCER